MKRYLSGLPILCFLLLLSTTTNLVGGDFKIGVSAYYSNNFQSNTGVEWPGLCSCLSDEASGRGYYIGIAAEVFQNMIFTDAIVMRLGMRSLPFHDNTKINYNVPKTIESNSLTVQAKCNFDVTTEINAFTFDFLYKVNISSSGFAFAIGPTVDYYYETNIQSNLTIIDPMDVVFPDTQTRTKEISDGEIEGLNDFSYGLKAGFQYDIDFDFMKVSLGAFYNYALEDITEDNWSVNDLQLGIDLLFKL